MSVKDEWQVREEICEAGRRLYMRHIIVATDGNISARLPGDVILITPAGACKGALSPEDLVKVDLDGNPIAGPARASTEFKMHAACYQERSDIRAVVHGHPPHVVAHLIAGKNLSACVIPEVVVHLGMPQVARYATPGTEELSRSIRDLVSVNDAVLMDHHGALTVGPDVMDAFYKMEKLEHAALIVYAARMMGRVRELEPEWVAELVEHREAAGMPGRINVECALPCETCPVQCQLRGTAGAY